MRVLDRKVETVYRALLLSLVIGLFLSLGEKACGEDLKYPLLTSSLYVGADVYSTHVALSKGGHEAGLPLGRTRVPLQYAVVVGTDLLLQKSRWKPAPWVFRGFVLCYSVWLLNHNIHVKS